MSGWFLSKECAGNQRLNLPAMQAWQAGVAVSRFSVDDYFV